MHSLDNRHQLSRQAVVGLENGPKSLSVHRVICLSEIDEAGTHTHARAHTQHYLQQPLKENTIIIPWQFNDPS